MTNLANILKYCPRGTKLYSPIFGEVIFNAVDDVCIDATAKPDGKKPVPIAFNHDGTLLLNFSNTECVLFPSKNQRDWTAFQIPAKRGDIMMYKDQSAVFMIDTMEDGYVRTIAYIDKEQGFIPDVRVYINYIPAPEDMKRGFFDAMDKAGYEWDGETLKKKEYQFKPFEKVLVRNGELAKWRCSLYSHFDQEGIYHHTTISGIYSMCIPFKGNEHLVGTTDNP